MKSAMRLAVKMAAGRKHAQSTPADGARTA
jgi:hypothetical protein